MSEISREYRNHSRIWPIDNQLFKVEPAPGNNAVLIQQLENVPDYRSEVIARWQESQSPSVTHKTFHGKARGKMSFEVDVPEIKTEYISIIEKEVIKAASYYNYEGRTPTLFARQMLIYEPGYGCVVHADDHDSGEDEYGIGTVVFNWGNQLIALLFVSTQGVDYEGGEFDLPNQNTMVKGKHGLLVMLPGGYEYKHGVAPILSGYRLAVQTTWRFDL